jgi:hypothetical protein
MGQESKTQMTSILKKSLIPLEAAFLCLDCSCISDGNVACPACSSSALLNLSNVLNRPSETCAGELYEMETAAEMETVAA